MRTTVSIDDNLLLAAKERARTEGRSLGDVLEDGIRELLTRKAEPLPPFDPPIFKGKLGVRPGVDLDSNVAIQELLDDGVPLDKLR